MGLISGSLVMVYAQTYFPSNDVTYDNTSSGMTSTDVQGAIDELYNTCFPKTGGDTILDNTDIVTSGDGLYKDEYEDRYFYKGANPNNYVSFNNELWRILGVIDGKIKIIRNESIGRMQWASNGSNNWDNSSLKSYLNGDYYNSIDGTYKNMISEETYYLGGATDSNYRTLTASGYYNVERSSTVYSGNPTSTIQYIGLMYQSDYGYAAGSSCLSSSLDEYGIDNECQNSDYLYSGNSNDSYEWLQAPYASFSNYAAIQDGVGYVGMDDVVYTYAVRPVLYLNTNVQITGGDGSQTSPFDLA